MKVEDQVLDLEEFALYGQKIMLGARSDQPTLVFLHDALGSVAGWRDFPAKLCEELGLNGFLYDRLGHGQSPPNEAVRPHDYLEREADLLTHVLNKAGLDHCILIGHSDGGSIALLHEAANRGSVGLVSLAGHIMVEDITVAGVREVSGQLKAPEKRLALEGYHGSKAAKLLNDWSTVWQHQEFRGWNICQELLAIQCPVLIIQGKDDEYATPAHATAIAECIGSNATEWLLDRCGHFPHKEHPERVIKAIANFIRSI